MRRAAVDISCSHVFEDANSPCQGPRGVDHVVRDEAVAPLNLTHNVEHLGHIGRGTPFVDDRKAGVQPFSESPGHLRAAHVWGNYHEILQRLFSEVLYKDRRCVHVVDRDVEVPL